MPRRTLVFRKAPLDELIRQAEDAFDELQKELGYVILDRCERQGGGQPRVYYKIGDAVLPYPLLDDTRQPPAYRRGGDLPERYEDPVGRGRCYRDDIVVRKRPRYVLGYGVLGRTWPSLRVIEIREDLEGREFYEVLLHELTHIERPYDSEYETRQRTRERLHRQGLAPVFH